MCIYFRQRIRIIQIIIQSLFGHRKDHLNIDILIETNGMPVLSYIRACQILLTNTIHCMLIISISFCLKTVVLSVGHDIGLIHVCILLNLMLTCQKTIMSCQHDMLYGYLIIMLFSSVMTCQKTIMLGQKTIIHCQSVTSRPVNVRR